MIFNLLFILSQFISRITFSISNSSLTNPLIYSSILLLLLLLLSLSFIINLVLNLLIMLLIFSMDNIIIATFFINSTYLELAFSDIHNLTSFIAHCNDNNAVVTLITYECNLYFYSYHQEF